MKSELPACIGIIMDGNRRWARSQGVTLSEGHLAGYKKAKEVAQWCRDAGVSHLILYAFSNENWEREPEEVSYLSQMFRDFIFSEADELRRENGAVRFIGDLSKFGEDFVQQAKNLESTNPTSPALTIVIALSYGGRQEITRAVQELVQQKKETVTEADIEAHLYTAGIPDPDLIIRTSGEQRLSNFLPWQAVYSELFFTKTMWPAFEKKEFENILNEYAARERRLGK